MDLSTRSPSDPPSSIIDPNGNLTTTELISGAMNREDFEAASKIHMAAAEIACNVSADSATQTLIRNGQPFCPRTFDGWSCWNETPAGATAYTPCPWFIWGFEPDFIAHKDCLPDGTWFRHPQSNLTWSNYTTCINYEAFQQYKAISSVYRIGYGISLIALISSLIIFSTLKSLKCPRITLHKHLFVSFITNNILWLVWYGFVMDEDSPVNELNQPLCIFIHLLVHYFMVANYFWMFCEGFYLHTLIVVAFVREKTLMKIFYVFGWFGPAIPVGLYASFRLWDEGARDCWIHDSTYSSFLSIPVCICLIVSVGFLMNIVRVLLLKLTANNAQHRVALNSPDGNGRRGSGHRSGETQQNLKRKPQPSGKKMIKIPTPQVKQRKRRDSRLQMRRNSRLTTLKQAARATIILIPLLGVHYFIIPLRPDPDSAFALYYQYIAAVSSSLQGLAVSLLFCFFNGEVQSHLKRKLCRESISKSTGFSTRGHRRNGEEAVTTQMPKTSSPLLS